VYRFTVSSSLKTDTPHYLWVLSVPMTVILIICVIIVCVWFAYQIMTVTWCLALWEGALQTLHINDIHRVKRAILSVAWVHQVWFRYTTTFGLVVNGGIVAACFLFFRCTDINACTNFYLLSPLPKERSV